MIPGPEYKLTYLASLAASAEFPGGVAPATIGASLVPPESSFLLLEPLRTRRGLRRCDQQG